MHHERTMNANVSGAAAAAAGARPPPDVTLYACAGHSGGQTKLYSFHLILFSPTSGDPFFAATILRPPRRTRAVVLTVTAACLTALLAACRASAAVPGFSRFLVNLRLDSAAISSSERSPVSPAPPVQPLLLLPVGARTGHRAPYPEPRARTYTHTHTRIRVTWPHTRTEARTVKIGPKLPVVTVKLKHDVLTEER